MVVFFYKVETHNSSVDKSTIMLVREFEILMYYRYEHWLL